MATVGQSLNDPEVGWKRFSVVDNAIKYTGSWSVQENNSYWAGQAYWTATVGDSASFSFKGTKLRLIGVMDSLRTSSVDITIDGVTENVSFNLASGGDIVGRYLMYQKLGLSDGEHSVKITDKASGYLSPEAIDIDFDGYLIYQDGRPVNLVATADDSKVNLSWDTVASSTGYNVKRSTTTGGPYTTVGANVPTNSFVDTTAQNGTTYYYVVTAITASGESANSNEASATPIAASVDNSKVLLRVTMNDSSEREYQLSTTEVSNFIKWYDRTVGTGNTCYVFDKNVGSEASKEYLAFEKIISFEVKPSK